MEVTLKDQNGKKWKMFQLIEAVEHNTAKLDETLTKVDVVKIVDPTNLLQNFWKFINF